MAKGLANLDRTQAARVLSDVRRRPPPSVFYWTWVNGLISGWLTHTKYVAANALALTSEHGVTTPLAATIGKVKEMTGLTTDVDRVFFGETAGATWGMIGAVPEAMMATVRSIYSGQRAVLSSELELHKQAVGRGDKVPKEIERAVNQVTGQGRPLAFQNSDVWGKITGGDWAGAAKDATGRALGAPGDVAMGIHTFFKILGERASLGARAYREAASEGHDPMDRSFWERRSEHLANPSDEMLNGARADAYKGTFMAELGPHGKAFSALLKRTPGLKWLFPFTHIPINLMKATYEHTPFAFLDGDMRANLTGKNGGIAQDKAIARVVAGSAVMGYFVNASLNGRATGDYPTDPDERAHWKLQGKQPNSILINGYWVSYNKFGPAGDLANLASNLGQVIPKFMDGWDGKDDEGMTKATWQMAVAASRLMADEVGFMSLSMIFEAMHDEKKGVSWVANQAATLVPYSSAMGQTASFNDPYMRESKTFLDGLKYKLPGLRGTLLPKRDALGDPIPNPQYGNIIRQREANADPVRAEMDRLGIHPVAPQNRVGGIQLTPELYDQYQVKAGAMAHTALGNWMRQPGWDNLPAFAREEVFRRTLEASHQAAAAQVQIENRQIIQQGVDNARRRIAGEKPQKKLVPAPPP